MNPETIAQIILASLQLANTIAENIPAAEHAKLWERHNRFLEWVEKLASGQVLTSMLPQPPQQPPN